VEKNQAVIGGKLVGNEFGAMAGDELQYHFESDRDVDEAQLTVFYSTLRDGASLDIHVDGKVIGDIKCPPTGGWWSFVGMPITMGPLSKGPHLLLIKSNGININLDRYSFSVANGDSRYIEAEDYQNATRLNHVQAVPSAHGGKIVDNEFGGVRGDSLMYEFSLLKEIKSGQFDVVYASPLNDAVCQILIDGNEVGKIKCSNTGSWFYFFKDSLPVKNLKPGKHILIVKSLGANLNIDYFVIYPTPAR
jgi:hypothetical protein